MLPALRQAGGSCGLAPRLDLRTSRDIGFALCLVKESGMRYALGPIRGAATLKKREIGLPCKPGTQRSLVAIFGESRFETQIPGELIEQFSHPSVA